MGVEQTDAASAVLDSVRSARPATMKDVAAAAGVGLKTVSRVVNSEPNVSREKTERVLQAIKDLGFRRNESARLLRQGQTASIGLIVENIADPFYGALARAVEEAAFQHGSLLLSASSMADPERNRGLVAAFSSRRLDGLIITAAASEDHPKYLEDEVAAGTRMVFIDQEPPIDGVDSVLTDNLGGAIGAVEHLLRGGHRRIACISHRAEIATIAQRIGGYRQALTAAGIPFDPALVHAADPELAGFSLALEAMLRLPEPPTAVFTTNNRSSAVLLRWLTLSDHRMAVVGFDDFELADAISPAITVVAQDPAEMGRRAVALLMRRLQEADAPPVREVVPTSLIVRGSGEIPPDRLDDLR